MGSFVSRTFPLVIGLLFLENFKYRFFLQLLICLICGILVFFSAERLAFIYFLIIFILFIFLTINKKNIFYITFIVIIFFSFLHIIKPSSTYRLMTHTINQISEKRNFSLFSYRHELHFITAFNLFNDSKLLGHGLKSFRHLCGLKNYVPTEKIIHDNTVFSNIEGQVFFLNNLSSKNKDFLILEKNFDDKKLAKIISETNFDEFYLFRKLDEGLYNYKFPNEFNGIYVKNNDFVRQGDPLGFNYEFSNGCNTHPHNIYFEFLSELGLIGLIFLLIGLKRSNCYILQIMFWNYF
jgi:O-antigen ligase